VENSRVLADPTGFFDESDRRLGSNAKESASSKWRPAR